jgi:hypothetical protein
MQTTEVLDEVVGKDRPKAFVGKVGHFVTDEINMFVGGFVGAMMEPVSDFTVGPTRAAGDDGHAMGPEGHEEFASRVLEGVKMWQQVALATCG